MPKLVLAIGLACLVVDGRAEDLDRRVVEGIGPESEDTTVVAGMDLSKQGYVQISQYALLDSNILFVAGKTVTGEFSVASLDLKTSKMIPIARFTQAVAQKMMEPRLMVCFVRNLAPSVPYVVLTYGEVGVISNKSSETETYLEVFAPDAQGNFSRICRAKVGETNVTFQRQVDEKSKYRYLAVDNSTEGPGEVNPAKKTEARILFLDANRDGYTDLVVWQRTYLSRLVADRHKDDFVLAEERALLMAFIERDRTFGSPKAMEKPVFDKELLWHVCFPSQGVFMSDTRATEFEKDE